MKVSQQISEEGQWVDLTGPFTGVSVKVMLPDSLPYRQANIDALQAHAKALRKGRLLGASAQDRVLFATIARGSLQDWKNVDDENGEPAPFSRDLAIAWSENPKYAKFFRAINEATDELVERNAEEREELGKS